MGRFYPGTPATAEAVAHLTQYDEGEDGILILADVLPRTIPDE